MNGSTSSEGNEVIQGGGLSNGDMETRSEVSQEPQGTTELESFLSAEEKKIRLSKNEKFQYRTDDDWVRALVISRTGKVTRKHTNWFNVKIEGSNLERSMNLEVVEWRRIADEEEVNIVMLPRARHREVECIQAKQVELKKLKNFQTYQEVDDLGQNWVSTTWVLWQKGDEVRARLVARDYEEEGDVRKDSPTIGKSIIKLFLTILWIVKTTDIKSAFLQGKLLDRDVYLMPPKEAGVHDGKLWKLKHCLYGLNDAVRQFYQSIVEVLKNLNCRQHPLEPALFYMKDTKNDLVGMVASHIDNFLHVGDPEFNKSVMDKVRERFLAGKLEENQV